MQTCLSFAAEMRQQHSRSVAEISDIVFFSLVAIGGRTLAELLCWFKLSFRFPHAQRRMKDEFTRELTTACKGLRLGFRMLSREEKT